MNEDNINNQNTTPDTNDPLKIFSNENDNIENIKEENRITREEEQINHQTNNIINTNNNNKKKNKFIYIIPIITLLSVLLLTIKTFTYGNKINEYEEVFIKIKEKKKQI